MAVEIGAFAIAKLAIIIGLVSALAFDARYSIIPDLATGFVAAGGLLLRLLQMAPSPLWSLLLAGVVLAGFMALAWRGVMGAGDAKLIAATTLIVPLHGVASLLLAITLAGGVLALVFILATWAFGSAGGKTARKGRSALGRYFRHRLTDHPLRASMPYAAAILGGVLWRLLPGFGS